MRIVRTSAAAMIAASMLGLGCATTTTYSADWPGPQDQFPQTGVVQSVRQVVRRVQGNPGAGAAAGALIGAVLFGGHGARTLFGAAAGAATGAALSQGAYETRAYEVVVGFDDGQRGVFTYLDESPFAPGDRVELGNDGLHPIY